MTPEPNPRKWVRMADEYERRGLPGFARFCRGEAKRLFREQQRRRNLIRQSQAIAKQWAVDIDG